MGGTVNDEVDSTYQGFPTRDARITGGSESSGKKGTVFIRVIVTPERLYQLIYVEEGADQTTPPADFYTFRDSMKIV